MVTLVKTKLYLLIWLTILEYTVLAQETIDVN